MSGHNASQRAEQRKLREQMRGLGMSYEEIAAEMARRFAFRPRAAWRVSWGWTLPEAAERYNALRGRGLAEPVTALTGSRLSEWENWPFSGRKPPVTALCLLAEIYQCGVLDLIDVSDRESLSDAELITLGKVAATPAGDQHGSTGSVPHERAQSHTTGVPELWDDLMLRRDFLYKSGAAAMMVGPPVYCAIPGSPHAAEAAAAYAELTAGYRRVEALLGPGSVYAQVSEHHRHLTARLPQIRDRTAWHQLAQVTADTGILLAWLCFDLDWLDQATMLYRQTFDLARELDDVNLAAFLAGRMSRTLSESGQQRDALEFAEAAHRIAGTAAAPGLRSWLGVTRAYVHACLGEERSCREALDSASMLITRDREAMPPYLGFYGEPYLDKWRGHALLALAERRIGASAGEGRAAVDRALASWSGSEVRESGEVLVAAARARLAQHETEEAERLAASAYDIATATGSPRIMRYVTGLRRQLQPGPEAASVPDAPRRLPLGW